jgi:hypothetical protein
MGQVYQCWWRICRDINVLSSSEYHIFYVLYTFVTYLLTLPRSHIHTHTKNNTAGEDRTYILERRAPNRTITLHRQQLIHSRMWCGILENLT